MVKGCRARCEGTLTDRRCVDKDGIAVFASGCCITVHNLTCIGPTCNCAGPFCSRCVNCGGRGTDGVTQDNGGVIIVVTGHAAAARDEVTDEGTAKETVHGRGGVSWPELNGCGGVGASNSSARGPSATSAAL